MKLNLGSGPRAVPGWTNVDIAPGARWAKLPLFRRVNRRMRFFSLDWDPGIVLADLRREFPWPSGSAEVIYVSHLLEHFTREEGCLFLRRCADTLSPRGILRIIVPDLAFITGEYHEGRIPATEFLERLGVLYHRTHSPLKDRFAPFVQFPHKCMYDAPALLSAVRDAGLAGEVRSPRESAIGDIDTVEHMERTAHAVIVEACKPAGPAETINNKETP